MLKKHEEKRIKMISELGNHTLEHGLQEASLRKMAQVLNMSNRMILHYFKDKEELMTLIINYLVEKLFEEIQQHGPKQMEAKDLLLFLNKLISCNDIKKFLKIGLQLATNLNDDEEYFKEFSKNLFEQFLHWIDSLLIVKNNDNRSSVSALILTIIEGFVLLDQANVSHVNQSALKYASELFEGA